MVEQMDETDPVLLFDSEDLFSPAHVGNCLRRWLWLHLLGARGWSPLAGILYDRRAAFEERERGRGSDWAVLGRAVVGRLRGWKARTR